MAGASVINAVVLHSGAIATTVPLCAAFTLIAVSRRAQIGNMAATIRRRDPAGTLPEPSGQDT
jgi:hypothetical protein